MRRGCHCSEKEPYQHFSYPTKLPVERKVYSATSKPAVRHRSSEERAAPQRSEDRVPPPANCATVNLESEAEQAILPDALAYIQRDDGTPQCEVAVTAQHRNQRRVWGCIDMRALPESEEIIRNVTV